MSHKSKLITFLAIHLESVYLINEMEEKRNNYRYMIFKCLIEQTVFTHLTADAW